MKSKVKISNLLGKTPQNADLVWKHLPDNCSRMDECCLLPPSARSWTEYEPAPAKLHEEHFLEWAFQQPLQTQCLSTVGEILFIAQKNLFTFHLNWESTQSPVSTRQSVSAGSGLNSTRKNEAPNNRSILLKCFLISQSKPITWTKFLHTRKFPCGPRQKQLCHSGKLDLRKSVVLPLSEGCKSSATASTWHGTRELQPLRMAFSKWHWSSHKQSALSADKRLASGGSAVPLTSPPGCDPCLHVSPRQLP